jgi:hypothetical protein
MAPGTGHVPAASDHNYPVSSLAVGRADSDGCQRQVREFDARGHPQLHEHLAQVVLDRLGTQEQLAGDVTVAGAARDQLGDAQLLRGQRVERRGIPLARGDPGGLEFGAAALGPERCVQALEGGERITELGARLRLALRAAQELPVGQCGPGPLERLRSLGLIAQRLEEQRLGRAA